MEILCWRKALECNRDIVLMKGVSMAEDEGDGRNRLVGFWMQCVDDRDFISDNDFGAERQSDRRSHGVVPYDGIYNPIEIYNPFV